MSLNSSFKLPYVPESASCGTVSNSNLNLYIEKGCKIQVMVDLMETFLESELDVAALAAAAAAAL